MRLADRLRELYSIHHESLPDHAWASESDRWAELVFCVLNECRPSEASQAREATDLLHRLGLLDVAALSGMEPPQKELIQAVLNRTGFAPPQTEKALTAMREIAAAVQSRYSGLIQPGFRKGSTGAGAERSSGIA